MVQVFATGHLSYHSANGIQVEEGCHITDLSQDELPVILSSDRMLPYIILLSCVITAILVFTCQANSNRVIPNRAMCSCLYSSALDSNTCISHGVEC